MNQTQNDPLRFLKPRKKNFHLTPTKQFLNNNQSIATNSKIQPYDNILKPHIVINKNQSSSNAQKIQKDKYSHNINYASGNKKIYNPLKYFSPQVEALLMNREPRHTNASSIPAKDINKHKNSVDNSNLKQNRNQWICAEQQAQQKYQFDAVLLNSNIRQKVQKQNKTNDASIRNLSQSILNVNALPEGKTSLTQQKRTDQSLRISLDVKKQNKTTISQSQPHEIYTLIKQSTNSNQNRKNYSQYHQQERTQAQTHTNQVDQIQNYEPQNLENTGQLRQCQTCARKFNPNSYQKHVKVCQKVFFNKRKQFSSQKQRSLSKKKK